MRMRQLNIVFFTRKLFNSSKRSSLVIFLFFISFISLAQDPNFSQFFNNPIYYNPGMTALDDGMRFRSNFRNLWGPIPSKFNTFSMSLDAQAVGNTGLGVIAVSDNEGEGNLRTNLIGGIYSYRPIETKNLKVQVGFSTTFVHKRIDWDQLVFSDNLDQVFGNVNESNFVIPANDRIIYPDFGAGAVVKFNLGHSEDKKAKVTSTIGASFHHLTKPKDALMGIDGRLPIKSVYHATFNFLGPNNIIYSPGFIYEKQSNLETFQIGFNTVKNPIYAGFWFRNKNFSLAGKRFDSFIFNLGLITPLNKYNRMRLCYSFDFTVSHLKTSSMGSHEIALVIEFDDKVLFEKVQSRSKNIKKVRMKECVDF